MKTFVFKIVVILIFVYATNLISQLTGYCKTQNSNSSNRLLDLGNMQYKQSKL